MVRMREREKVKETLLLVRFLGLLDKNRVRSVYNPTASFICSC